MWRAGRGGHSLRRSPPRPALSSYARPRSSGEIGVCRLRPQAFLCGVGGFSPPSAARCGCGQRSPALGAMRQSRKHGCLFSTSRHICPEGGGRCPQGGAHTLPPSTRPAHVFAVCPLARHAPRPRFACGAVNPRSLIRSIAALRSARGLPLRPRPLRSRALGRFAPRRALSPPSPWARCRAPPCFGGLLRWAALFAAIDGWALSRCRPPYGRPHALSCPLGIASRGRSIISLCVWSRGALRAPHR